MTLAAVFAIEAAPASAAKKGNSVAVRRVQSAPRSRPGPTSDRARTPAQVTRASGRNAGTALIILLK
jgi:hypothetical protein